MNECKFLIRNNVDLHLLGCKSLINKPFIIIIIIIITITIIIIIIIIITIIIIIIKSLWCGSGSEA